MGAKNHPKMAGLWHSFTKRQEGHRQKRLVQMEATELCDPRRFWADV